MEGFNSFLKIISIVFILGANTLYSQWEQCKGPSGGNVRAIAVAGDSIMTGTDAGVYLSTNKGANWSLIGLSGLDIRSLVAIGGNIIAGTEVGLYLNMVGDTKWSQINTGIGSEPQVECLTTSGNNTFAGVLQGGVYQSTNKGASWKTIGLKSYGVKNIIASMGKIYAITSSGTLYQTVNNGISWNEITGFGNYDIRSLVVNGTYIIAGTSGGAFLSNDNGKTWKQANTGLTTLSIVSMAINGNRIYAGTDAGIFLTLNNGTSWTEVNSGLSAKYINCLTINGTDIFAGTTGGAFLSTDNGADWEKSTSWVKITNDDVKHLVIGGNNMYAASWNGTIFVSANNGATWAEIFNNYFSVNAFVANDSKLFVGLWGGGVLLSKNNGVSWTAINNGLETRRIGCLATNGTKMFAGLFRQSMYDSGGVFVSTNDGASWDTTKVHKDNITSLAASGNNIFAGSYSGLVSYSNDNGVNWDSVSLGYIINCFAIDGNNVYAGTRGGVFISTDGGINWAESNKGITATNVSSIIINGNKIFAGTTERGVFLSMNNGRSWTEMNKGLNDKVIECFAINGSDIYVGTWSSSLFKAKVADFIGVEDAEISNNDLSIYPNPAQNSLNIRLGEESALSSSIRVLDVCGRTVAESQVIAGTKEMTLDLKEFPVGIYLLNVMSGNSIKSQKFAVCR